MPDSPDPTNKPPILRFKQHDEESVLRLQSLLREAPRRYRPAACLENPACRKPAWNRRRRTMGNIRQNLFFAFIYNGLVIPVAAGVLYPLIGLLLNPMVASGAMALSSVSVIFNALRRRHAEL